MCRGAVDPRASSLCNGFSQFQTDEHESRRLIGGFLFDGEAGEIKQGFLREGWSNVMFFRLRVRTVQL